MIKAALAGCAIFALAACGDSTTSIGPLSMKVPKGWQVSDREPNNLKLTDGSIGEPTGTKPGTATAVFDIYTESSQTTKAFLAYLREQRITPKQEHIVIDGSAAERFVYSGRSVGGRQEAVIVPEQRVFILYRAAFRGDDDAFLRGRAAFRFAVRSITFSGSDSALGGSSSATGSGSGSGSSFGSTTGVVRHGPILGKITRTAIAAPTAIMTKPS